MQIGVGIPHTGVHASSEMVREWCTTAEQLGFGSLWGVDHLVMPQHNDSKYILPRNPAAIEENGVSALLSPNFEVLITLA